MGRISPLLLLLLLLSASAFAQADSANSPAVWERYKIGRHELSVDLPKMPIRVGSQDMCSNFQKHSFFSYSDETIYEVTVVVKIDLPLHPVCREKRLFSENTLAARLDEIRSGKSKMLETALIHNDRQSYRFAGGEDVRLIIPDMERNRWIELAIIRREDKKSFEESFVKSLDLAGATGKEVGGGAPSIIGDPVQAREVQPQATEARPQDAKSASSVSGDADAKQIAGAVSPRILAKPKAVYTDAARRANVQGSIRMKVTLMSNGAVGNITLVTELPHGLNEQAIAATRKLAFLPARVNGVAVSKIATFEYGFSIY